MAARKMFGKAARWKEPKPTSHNFDSEEEQDPGTPTTSAKRPVLKPKPPSKCNCNQEVMRKLTEMDQRLQRIEDLVEKLQPARTATTLAAHRSTTLTVDPANHFKQFLTPSVERFH